MTLTFERKLYSIKMNEHTNCLEQRSFDAEVTVWTHIHPGPTAQPGPLKWSVTYADVLTQFYLL